MYQTGFTGSASKLNFTNNVTSDIQAQIDKSLKAYTGMTPTGMLIIVEGTYTKVTKSSYYIGLHKSGDEALLSVAFLPIYVPANTGFIFYPSGLSDENLFMVDLELPGYLPSGTRIRQYFISNFHPSTGKNYLYIVPLT